MTDRYTVSDLFSELDGKSYVSYRDFEQAVIELFNEHLHDFPPHYSYRDAIRWADRNGWLKPDNGGLQVEFNKAVA